MHPTSRCARCFHTNEAPPSEILWVELGFVNPAQHGLNMVFTYSVLRNYLNQVINLHRFLVQEVYLITQEAVLVTTESSGI
jgi:hypothetical protein